MSLQSLLIYLLLFVTPFIVIPFYHSPFEIPKVLFAQICIIFLCLLRIFSPKSFSFSSYNKLVLPLLGGIVLLSLFHLIFFYTNLSLFGNSFRLQGTVLLWLLIIFSFLSSSVSLPKHVSLSIPLLLGIQLLIAFFLGANEIGRAYGTLGEPNSLAAYAIATWPFIFAQKSKSSLLVIFFTLLAVTSIIWLSGSRSGLIALLLQLVFFMMVYKFRFSLLKSLSVCIALLLLSLALPLFENFGLFENRTIIWQTAVVAGSKSPLIGHGFGNIELALKDAAVMLENAIRFTYVDSSHNIFLDWWVQGGIVGLGLFLLTLYKVFSQFVKQKKAQELLQAIGIITVLCFNPVSIVILLLLWWIIGQGIRGERIS